MKLIGSRWRERVGKPGLIKNEQRVVRTLLACGSSAEKARMQVFSVRCQALSATSGLARQLQRQRVAVQKLVN